MKKKANKEWLNSTLKVWRPVRKTQENAIARCKRKRLRLEYKVGILQVFKNRSILDIYVDDLPANTYQD